MNDYIKIWNEFSDLHTLNYKDRPTAIKLLISKYQLNNNYDEYYRIVNSIKPVLKGDLYSASDTLASIEDKNIKAYLRFWYELPRSYAKGPCFLIPIGLCAYKRLRNIPYNQWHKDDKIKYFMGVNLSPIVNYTNSTFSLKHLNYVREIHSKTRKSYVNWPVKSNVNIDDTNYKLTDPGILIRYQLWKANVEYRNDEMILDLDDWSHMPEALDVKIEDEKSRSDYWEIGF